MKILINRNSDEWKRYAAAALGGLLANHVSDDEEMDHPVSAAADMADEMYVERERRGSTEEVDTDADLDVPPSGDAS